MSTPCTCPFWAGYCSRHGRDLRPKEQEACWRGELPIPREPEEAVWRSADATTSATMTRVPWPLGEGPGTELRDLIASLGISDAKGCGCLGVARWMSEIGPDGCRVHRDAILAKLRHAQGRLGWVETLKAAAHAALSGLAFRLDPADPAPGLLDEALRRWEQHQPAKGEGREGAG